MVLENSLYATASSINGWRGVAEQENLKTNPSPQEDYHEVQNALYNLESSTDEESGEKKKGDKLHSNPSNKDYEEKELIHGRNQA